MKIEELVPVEYSGQRLLTTKQLAEAYSCSVDTIKHNFRRAKDKFIEGVHYFKLSGEELKKVQDDVLEGIFFHPTGGYQNPVAGATNTLILYTVQGAARHCKMINTKEAWEVFAEMEQFYFDNNGVEAVQESNPFLQEQINKLQEEVEGLKGVLEAWIENMEKLPNPQERADKLIALADRIKDDSLRDKILAKAANLLLGKNIF